MGDRNTMCRRLCKNYVGKCENGGNCEIRGNYVRNCEELCGELFEEPGDSFWEDA